MYFFSIRRDCVPVSCCVCVITLRLEQKWRDNWLCAYTHETHHTSHATTTTWVLYVLQKFQWISVNCSGRFDDYFWHKPPLVSHHHHHHQYVYPSNFRCVRRRCQHDCTKSLHIALCSTQIAMLRCFLLISILYLHFTQQYGTMTRSHAYYHHQNSAFHWLEAKI